MTWPEAVYIHVPFCFRRCGYCDFTLVADRDQLIPRWFDCLGRELQVHREQAGMRLPVSTVFFGGGTPTHLDAGQLHRLLELIRSHFEWSDAAEISMEANPEALDEERLEALQRGGVNRISLGVQSFDDTVLKVLERAHTADVAEDAVRRVAARFPAVSLDLIFGVPEQSSVSWEQTLRRAVSLPVQHVSAYGLTWEQGTSFFRREQQGRMMRATEELEREMFLQGIEVLQQAGFEHYEVSNYARRGFRCRHNLVYWHAKEYLAFGPGAARYVRGIRSTNCRSVLRWLNSWESDQACLEETETLGHADRVSDALMLALRLREGFRVRDFEDRFSIQLQQFAGGTVRRLRDQGLLELVEGTLRLTLDGLLLADTVAAEMLNPEAGH